MEPMRLGVSLNCIAMEITPEVLDAVQRSAIAAIEAPAVFFAGEAGERNRALVREKLPGRVASIHALFGKPYDFSSLEEPVWHAATKEAFNAVELAADLGAGLVVLHLSSEPIAVEERAARIKQAEVALQAIENHADDLSVRIAVELLPRTCLGNTVEELLEVLDGCAPRTVGACLDVNHVMDRYRELPKYVRILGDRLIHLHLSDYDGVDEKHWMPGAGVIDWKGLMEALRDTGYTGPLHYESSSQAQTIPEKIRDFEENYAWLRRMLRE